MRLFKRIGHFYSPYCTSQKCHKIYFGNIQKNIYVNNQQLREKHQKDRVNYLKKKTGKTAWERRNAGEMSYLERWFFDQVIIKYDLTKQYDIISEFSVYPYFIDFAFTNIKLAVQLDGKCHFIHGNKRIEHDLIKDKHLIQQGWKVFRISYNQVNENTIQNFLTFLNAIEIPLKILIENRVYKYTQVKKFKKLII